VGWRSDLRGVDAEATASVRTDFLAPLFARVLFGLEAPGLRTSRSKSVLPTASLRGGTDRIAPSRSDHQPTHPREQGSLSDDAARASPRELIICGENRGWAMPEAEPRCRCK